VSLQRVRLTAFRCFEAEEIALHDDATFILGPNGAGKTSILEAIFVLGRGRSFRARQMRTLVRHGADGFAVFGELEDPAHKVGVSYRAGRLEKKADGQTTAGMVELAQLLPAYSIDPGLHAIIEGGPGERRRLLDWGVFHVEHGYLDSWRRYRRVLGQRNAVLKQSPTEAELRPWSDALRAAAIEVDQKRQRYVAGLGPHVAHFGRRLLGAELTADYRRGWAAEVEFLQTLRQQEPRDRELGTTSVGPHRADLVIKIDGRFAQTDASRGQQKLAVAALALAQVQMHQAADRSRAVLLVDDPAAELDAGGCQRLTASLAEVGAQLVVTGLTAAGLDTHRGAVFHVEQGRVRAL
jgi:DNA replication and repair protein RecF